MDENENVQDETFQGHEYIMYTPAFGKKNECVYFVVVLTKEPPQEGEMVTLLRLEQISGKPLMTSPTIEAISKYPIENGTRRHPTFQKRLDQRIMSVRTKEQEDESHQQCLLEICTETIQFSLIQSKTKTWFMSNSDVVNDFLEKM